MNTKSPAYITVDIPEPVNSSVREIRRTYGNLHETIPVEITLAGSSGVGPIPVGTSLELIRSEVDRIARELRACPMSFRRWTTFPNTTLAYLEPSDRSIFDQWHQLFTHSNIPFSEIPFPYNPHCTIRRFATKEDFELAAKSPFPSESFEIDTISIYDLCPDTLQCELLHRVTL